MKAIRIAIALALVSSQAVAAPPCRDGKGKFVACAPAAAAAPKRCRDARGKFIPCPAAPPAAHAA